MAALAPWVAKGSLEAIEIPAAFNPLATQLTLAALKAGTASNSVNGIVQALRSGRVTTLAIMGPNMAVNEATVQAALKQFAGSAANVRTTLLMVGEPEDRVTLIAVALSAGVRLEIAPLP